MDCNTVEQAIVECGAELPGDVRAHLAACPSCQGFARLQQALLNHEAGAAPAPALEQAVLAAAHRRLRRGWRSLPSLRLWYRAAAALVVLAGMIGFCWRQRLETRQYEAVAGGAPQAAATPRWAGAQVDLEVIEEGLDAALAELGALGTPATHGLNTELGGQEPWDVLTELEFDVYFESESLRQAGG